MKFREAIISQYHAALEMLKQAILTCPESLWNNPDDHTKFWQITYHALFYTHLYLQDSAQTFSLWSEHRDMYQLDWAGPDELIEPPTKALVLEYLTFCQHQVVERVSDGGLEAASGFDWLRFSKFELHIYSIRHIQQHVGELMERMGAKATVDWIGSYDANHQH